MTACSSFPDLKELSFCQLRGSTGDKRRFAGRHLRQKKNQKAGWGWSLLQKIGGKQLEVYKAFMYPKLLKILSLLIPSKPEQLSQMGNTNINEKSFSIYHLISLVYLIVSLLDKIKLCMAGPRGCNQISLINPINSTNKTDLKNGSIK